MVNKLVVSKEPSNGKSLFVSRLFHAIAETKFGEVQQFLVKYNVRASVTNEDGDNVLIVALFIEDDAKRHKMLKYLLRHGADSCFVNKNSGMSVLAWACNLGLPEEVKLIFAHALGNIDLRSQDNEGMIPLHHGCFSGKIEVVRLVLDEMVKYKLPVDVPDNTGLTPYLYARRLGFKDIADMLNRRGKAARTQFDNVLHRTATFWQEKGEKERELDAVNELKEWHRWARILGRLPSMEKNTKNKPNPVIQVTCHSPSNSPPKVSRSLDEASMRKEALFVGSNRKKANSSYGSKGTPDILLTRGSPTDMNDGRESMLSKSSHSFLSYRGRLNMGRAAGRFGALRPMALSPEYIGSLANSPRSVTNDNVIFGDTMQLLAEIKGEHVQNFVGSVCIQEDTKGHDHSQGTCQNLDLSSMFDVLSEQSTNSYRETRVKPPTPPPPVIKKKVKQKSNRSTLAIIMGRARAPSRRRTQKSRSPSGPNSRRSPRTTNTSSLVKLPPQMANRKAKRGIGSQFLAP